LARGATATTAVEHVVNVVAKQTGKPPTEVLQVLRQVERASAKAQQLGISPEDVEVLRNAGALGDPALLAADKSAWESVFRTVLSSPARTSAPSLPGATSVVPSGAQLQALQAQLVKALDKAADLGIPEADVVALRRLGMLLMVADSSDRGLWLASAKQARELMHHASPELTAAAKGVGGKVKLKGGGTDLPPESFWVDIDQLKTSELLLGGTEGFSATGEEGFTALQLAKKIASEGFDPNKAIIVAGDGRTILNGIHRRHALGILGVKQAPARMVRDALEALELLGSR
jgi:hypothetical protein